MIITFNEEHNIAECIRSVAGARRVIVIDSGSTDRTREIASAAGCEVVIHKFINFAEQHNFGLSLASSEWVLHLDADERVTPALWQELTTRVAEDADGFLIPTLNFVSGAALRHGGWYPQYHVRLHRRGEIRWVGDVHEVVVGARRVLKTDEAIVHIGHPDLATFINKLNRYTSLEADSVQGSQVTIALRAAIEPVAYFIYKYVIQLGFLDGWRGLAAALLLAFYRAATYLKALERRARSSAK